MHTRRFVALAGVWVGLAGGFAAVVWAQTPLTALFNLRARTDSTGALMVTEAATVLPQTALTAFGNLRGRTDASGNLLVAVAGGTSTPDKVCLDATNQDACLQRNGAGILQLGNAATSTDFARLQFGGSTSSFPALKRNGATLQVKLADDSGFATLTANQFTPGTNYNLANMIMSVGVPSAPASCGTSPAVTTTNGSAVWVITGGTGGAATGCSVTMPTASNGWNCSIVNITQTAAHRADRATVQTASTVSSVTWEYVIVSTGAATAFTASDVFRGLCLAY